MTISTLKFGTNIILKDEFKGKPEIVAKELTKRLDRPILPGVNLYQPDPFHPKYVVLTPDNTIETSYSDSSNDPIYSAANAAGIVKKIEGLAYYLYPLKKEEQTAAKAFFDLLTKAFPPLENTLRPFINATKLYWTAPAREPHTRALKNEEGQRLGSQLKAYLDDMPLSKFIDQYLSSSNKPKD